MNKVGFIGYGSMGGMLVNGFISSSLLVPDEVIVSSRTMAKLRSLPQIWPGVLITDNNELAAQNSRLLFVCVKPLDLLPILDQIREHLTEETHLVSIAASVTIGDIENLFQGKVTKVIPSLTSEVKEGISLVCHNSRVGQKDAEYVENLFQSISRTVTIDENEFEVAADFTSCAPGIIAAIFQNFVEAGLKHSGLPKEIAQQMVISTLFGTAKLLLEREMSFSQMISRVATKGGITEEAVKVLNRGLPSTFDEVYYRTLNKHNHVKELVKNRG